MEDFLRFGTAGGRVGAEDAGRFETARLAVRRRRVGVLMAVSGIVLFSVFVSSGIFLQNRADDLAASGVRVQGTVVVVNGDRPSRSGFVHVRFMVDGDDRVRVLSRTSSEPVPRVGDTVTVMYDPADPDRLRTSDLANDPWGLTVAMVFSFVPSLCLIPGGFLTWLDRERRLRARSYVRSKAPRPRRGRDTLVLWRDFGPATPRRPARKRPNSRA
ncbi:DUF3592 domain-containing protein [Amycolatopsis sp. NPDC004079]|uniref:DUF3592 domain-containing protein n=1 Tax=Amycolatopsis sp. NPDC004079 TaxID=3154549 RepID=UPI0033A32824